MAGARPFRVPFRPIDRGPHNARHTTSVPHEDQKRPGTTRNDRNQNRLLRLDFGRFSLVSGYPRNGRRRTHNPKVAGSNPAPATESPGQRTANQGFYRSRRAFFRFMLSCSNVSTRAFVEPMTFGFLRSARISTQGDAGLRIGQINAPKSISPLENANALPPHTLHRSGEDFLDLAASLRTHISANEIGGQRVRAASLNVQCRRARDVLALRDRRSGPTRGTSGTNSSRSWEHLTPNKGSCIQTRVSAHLQRQRCAAEKVPIIVGSSPRLGPPVTSIHMFTGILALGGRRLRLEFGRGSGCWSRIAWRFRATFLP